MTVSYPEPFVLALGWVCCTRSCPAWKSENQLVNLGHLSRAVATRAQKNCSGLEEQNQTPRSIPPFLSLSLSQSTLAPFSHFAAPLRGTKSLFQGAR